MSTPAPTNVLDVTVVDSNRAPWDLFVVPQTGAEIPSKALVSDPDTGMQVFKMRYPAGFVNTWHTHSHAHGMYVLNGVLHTHQGDHGPGSFVWSRRAAGWNTARLNTETSPSCSSRTSRSTSPTKAMLSIRTRRT